METDLSTNALKSVGALLLVLGLIVCLFYVLKKTRLGRSAQGPARLRLLNTLSVAPKRSVALVEVRDQWLVVGVGAESVTLLCRMERPEGGQEGPARGFSTGTDFKSVLEDSKSTAAPDHEQG